MDLKGCKTSNISYEGILLNAKHLCHYNNIFIQISYFVVVCLHDIFIRQECGNFNSFILRMRLGILRVQTRNTETEYVTKILFHPSLSHY